MADLPTIFSAALTSLRTATDIAKLLRDTDATLERAELKMKLADLLGSLADLKLELTEVQGEVAARDARIAELEEAFESRDKLVRKEDAYYRKNEAGEPTGFPLCLCCWDVEHRQRQLIHDPDNYRTRLCPVCNARYEGRLAARIQAQR